MTLYWHYVFHWVSSQYWVIGLRVESDSGAIETVSWEKKWLKTRVWWVRVFTLVHKNMPLPTAILCWRMLRRIIAFFLNCGAQVWESCDWSRRILAFQGGEKGGSFKCLKNEYIFYIFIQWIIQRISLRTTSIFKNKILLFHWLRAVCINLKGAFTSTLD